MPTIQRTTNAINISNVQAIVSNKRERDNYTFRFNNDGTGGYLLDGELVEEKQFQALFPITSEPIRTHGKNPDGTRII